MHRTITLAALAAGSTLLSLPAAAQADVTVNPPALPAQSHQVLSVRVPTEDDRAATTKVGVSFPTVVGSTGAGRPPARAAHTGIVSRTPAPGSRARNVKRVAITFSRKLVTGKIDVFRGGTRVAPAASGPSGATVAARFSRKLAAGGYTAKWRAVASDGHVQSGSWSFRVR